MLATPTSRWTAGAGALCVVLLLLSWFLLVAPQRAQAQDLQLQREAVDGQNQALEQRVQELEAQFAELPARRAELEAVRAELPAGAELPALVRELSAHADASAVDLVSVAPGAPAPLPAAAPAARPVPVPTTT